MKPTENRPRVLMIAYACNPEGSGEHWLGWGWAEQAACECELHLITTPNARSQVESQAARHGITAHFVGLPGWLRVLTLYLGATGGWLRKLAWQTRVVRLAKALHQEQRFQIVHQTTFHSYRVPFLATSLGIPSVWGPIAGGESAPPGFGRYLGLAVIGESARKFLNRLWLGVPAVRRSLRRANVIFVSNQTTLKFLPAVHHHKCLVVPPNALRPEDLEASAGGASSSREPLPDHRLREPPTEVTPGPLRLLYVGNCVATRALPLVFEALRRRQPPDCRLTVVGHGPALPRWRRLVRKYGLSPQIEFTGQVARNRLGDFYAGADALIFPALRDSGGSALLEAMARGVPVICLDWAGPGEMVDGQSGIKLPIRDPEETVAALSAAITKLKAQPQLRADLARAARSRALTRFRWETKRRLLAACYQQLISAT